jgi:hypothetical protein
LWIKNKGLASGAGFEKMGKAASVGGLFLFDVDFSVSAVSELKSHHQHF